MVLFVFDYILVTPLPFGFWGPQRKHTRTLCVSHAWCYRYCSWHKSMRAILLDQHARPQQRMCMRSKAWLAASVSLRLARLPPLQAGCGARVAYPPRLRLRHAFSCMLSSQSSKSLPFIATLCRTLSTCHFVHAATRSKFGTPSIAVNVRLCVCL